MKTRHLIDADTNEVVGAATTAQVEASDAAAEKGEFGLFLIDSDGRPVNPSEVGQPWCPTARRVYVESA